MGRQFARLIAEQARIGVEPLAKDTFGRLGGDFLDVHTPFAGDHQHRSGTGAVDDDAQVQLAGDVAAFFDEHLADDLAGRAGLDRHQVMAQQGRRHVAGFGSALDQLNAVLLRIFFERAFAAATGMDLGLDDGQLAAQLVERRGRLVTATGYNAARHGDSGVAKDLFGLEFVDFHARGRFVGSLAEGR